MGFIQQNLPEILQIGGCLTSLTGTALMPRATRKYIKMEEKGFETNGDQVKALVKCYALPVGLSLGGTTATLTGCYIQHENVKSLRGEVAIATSAATTAAQIANGYRDYISKNEGPEKAKEVHKEVVSKATSEKVPYIPDTDTNMQAVNLLKVYRCTDGRLTWYTSINKLMFDIIRINKRLNDEGYMSYYEVAEEYGCDIPPFAEDDYKEIGFGRWDIPVEIDEEGLLCVDTTTGEEYLVVKYYTKPHEDYKNYY